MPRCRVLRHPALPGQPHFRVFLDGLLPQHTKGFGHGRGCFLLLRVEQGETFDGFILCAESGLLALLAERVPEANRVGVRAASRLGALTNLEEGPHTAGELSRHDQPFFDELGTSRAGWLRSPEVSKAGTRRRPMLTVC